MEVIGWGAGWELVGGVSPRGASRIKNVGGEGLVMKTHILLSQLIDGIPDVPPTATAPAVGYTLP